MRFLKSIDFIRICDFLNRLIYIIFTITFDIDGIDPTFAPGTGTPEVGGFNVRESQLIIRALNKINFIGSDVVEVSPPFDVNNMTSLVGATIAFEILCTMTKTS